MPGLNEKLSGDLTDAMKQKNEPKKTAIRMVKAAIRNEEIASQTTLDDEGILLVISKISKQYNDSITQFRSANRNDLVEKEQSELNTLLEYLPKQLSEDEIIIVAQDTISNLPEENRTNFGIIMKDVMPKLKGQADGSIVSKIIKDLLL
jgi:uncharacterized protein YqeY|tara:strand:+ start:272 stop:718 length:447 start_codon:yes stop_codon:yes gene_type:complete